MTNDVVAICYICHKEVYENDIRNDPTTYDLNWWGASDYVAEERIKALRDKSYSTLYSHYACKYRRKEKL